MISHSWFRGQLPKLIEDTKLIGRLCPEHELVNGWSALKLIALGYYVGFYTNIIPNHFSKMYYLDLCAGPGINKVKKSGDLLAGSPIITGRLARKTFDNMFLIEAKPKRRKCLSRRINSLKNKINSRNVEIIGLKRNVVIDCNYEIEKISPILKRNKSHYLAFIDPNGLEVSWKTIVALLACKGDLIIRFPTNDIHNRVWKAAIKENIRDEKAYNIKSLVKFFGSSILEEVERKTRDIDLLERYMQQIKTNGREITIPIPIKEGRGKNYHYHLILAVKKTRGNNPWLPAINNMVNRIENYSSKAIERALNVYTGRSRELEWFFTTENKSGNRNLDDWCKK